MFQNLFDQILCHIDMAAGEGFDKLSDIAASLHRDRGKLQAGDPTFGAGFKSGHILSGKIQAHDLIEKCGCLFCCEAQIHRADFDQLIARAKTRQRPGRINARGNDEM
jgi:hypothetical protein